MSKKQVNVTVDEREERIIIEEAPATLTEIATDFAQQLNEFIENYRPALEVLAKRPFPPNDK